jgi:UDP-2,3-diacylglucosamine pyrophosphatase LpxH
MGAKESIETKETDKTEEPEETRESMETEGAEELIVISDLHLSDGKNTRTRKYSRNEDFFFDREFKRFLEHLQKKPPKKHLIIAGDMFDFLQVTPDLEYFNDYPQVSGLNESDITKRDREYGFGTQEKKTVWKLRVIAKGHKEFFDAVASFISKGNSLSIISGNHDIELYWSKVQDEFREIIFESKAASVTKYQVEKNINFFSWFYYDEELKTYIEHGNQYDTFNSFEYFLYPRLEHGSEKVWLPFGSYFVRYFFNKLEEIHPFADNIKPSKKYMRWAWKEDKVQFLKNILSYLPTMLRIYIGSGDFSKNAKGKLEKENTKGLNDLAKRSGLQQETVTKIYNLKASPFTSHKILNALTFSNGFFVGAAVILAIVLLVLPLVSNLSFWNALYSLILLILPVSRWLSKYLPKKYLTKIIKEALIWLTKHCKIQAFKWLLEFFEKEYFKKALQIRKYIRKDNQTDNKEDSGKDKVEGDEKNKVKDVKFVVFGHTHDPDIRPDSRATDTKEKEFRYFNTGTWTTVFSEEERIIREAKQFSFVRIKGADGEPEAELLRWNDCIDDSRPIILYEPKPPEPILIVRIVKGIYNFFVL